MKGYLYIAVAVVVWGLEYVLIKKITFAISPLLAGAVIFITAAFLLAATLSLKRDAFRPVIFRPALILLVGITGAACNLMWLYGLKLTSIANAAILGRADIFFTFLLSGLLFHEKIRLFAWFSAPVMLAGIFLTTQTDFSCLSLGAVGDYLILGSALFLTLNAFFIKKAMRKVDGLAIALGNTVINAAVFSFAFLLEKEGAQVVSIPAPIWLMLIACGACTYIFFAGYYAGLRFLPVWEIRLLCLGVPFVAVCAGAAWGEKMPEYQQLWGGLLLIAGAAGIILSSGNGVKKTSQLIIKMKPIGV